MKTFAVEELPAAAPYSKEVFDELGMRGINCGCGSFLRPACLNVDRLQMADGAGNTPRPGKLARVQIDDETVYYMQHDLEKAFPLPDAAFDWGYSEHFIEHVSPAQAIDWLTEMRRIIKPGGLLRLTTPDLRKYIEGYLDPEGAFFELHKQRLELSTGNKGSVPPRRAWMVNQIFRFFEHQWIYDFDEIVYAATCAGFDRARIFREEFQSGLLENVAMLDFAERNDETLYVEMMV